MSKIKCIKVSPLMAPETIEVEASLEGLQQEVGGYIEFIYPFTDERVALVCNDEGKLLGLMPNRGLYCDGQMYDVVCGDFLVTAYTEDGENTDLTAEQVKKYTEMYRMPELIF